MHVCEICGEDFPSLTELYKHKHMHKQSLVLHSHGTRDRAIVPYKKGGKVTPYVSKKRYLDSDSDSSYKRKKANYKRGRELDSDFEDLEAKRYRQASDLEPIEYKPDANKLAVVPYVKRRKRKQKRKFITPKTDSDSEDDVNYNKLKNKFEKICQEELLNQKREFEKHLGMKQEEINKIKSECSEQISVLEKQISEKEEKYKTKINEKDEKFKNELNEHMHNYTSTMSEMENHYENQINLLREKVKSLEGDDQSLKPLSDAIFNCITIEEIFKIKKLIRNREFDELVNGHLDTLQKLFLSLSYGVIPICQPQREVISESQRKLIQKIETSSPSKAKTLIMQNRSEIINIFHIIEQSLELAIVSYDKFRRL